jgi:hypothetical protein
MTNLSLVQKELENLTDQVQNYIVVHLVNDGLNCADSHRMCMINGIRTLNHMINGITESDLLNTAKIPQVESYKVMALNTSHLTKEDLATLTREANDPEQYMVLSREPGFFIKLYTGEFININED